MAGHLNPPEACHILKPATALESCRNSSGTAYGPLQPEASFVTYRVMPSQHVFATKALSEQLPRIVFTDDAMRYRYSFDGLKISFLPEAVVIPTEAEQVGTILQLANQYRVPVTTRGVGSTLTGSATPVHGGWVLDLHLLNSIHIDTVNRMATVGAGAVVKDIQDAAAACGLFYPPDPSSYKWCTIGGNIACNAGGLRCVKYGVTRDYLISHQRISRKWPCGSVGETGKKICQRLQHPGFVDWFRRNTGSHHRSYPQTDPKTNTLPNPAGRFSR
jgi:predicted RNA binding protein YcfA (HicA-like mRNA interferase family)